MKAADLLLWFVENGINCENINHQCLDEEDFKNGFVEEFFGAIPEKNLSFGDYIYIYSDVIDEDEPYFLEIKEKADLVLHHPDGFRIYLFRID